MCKRNLRSFFVLILGIALLTACNGAATEAPAAVEEAAVFTEEPAIQEPDTFSTDEPAFSGPVVYYRTKVLGGDLLNRYLWGVEGNTYIFSFQILDVITLEPEDILVGEITEQTPYGFLRKVIRVESDGYSLLVETEPAALADAFVQAEIDSEEHLLTNENIQDYWEITGLQRMTMGVPRLASPAGFSLNLRDVVLYDDDLDLNSKGDQVVVNGSISLDPCFTFSARIMGQELTDLTFLLDATQTSELTVSSTMDFLSPLMPDPIQIAWYRFKPVVVWVDFVPVIITPELSLYAGLDGKISASISTGITQESKLTSGVIYRNGPNGDWEMISPNEGWQPGIPAYQPPEFEYESEVKTFARAQIQLMIYDLVGPTGKLDGYLKLEIFPDESNWWKLYNGIKVNIGIKAEVFSHVFMEYSKDVYKAEWLIDQAQGPEVEAPVVVPTATATDEVDGGGGWSCWTWGFIIAGVLLLLYYLGTKEN